MKIDPKYRRQLEHAKELKTLRVLPDYALCTTDFVSNDYLGMARIDFPNPQKKIGSGLGSRLIAGNSREAQYCEAFLAELFSAESALVFNSGYDANLGFFSTVPQKNEVVLYDQLIHASIRDGLRLSQASSYAFAHNNLEDLEAKLLRFQNQTVWIVVEGVYSMDGDQAPLEAILNLAQRFDAHVVVDEAHSLGVLGENGLGLSSTMLQHPNLVVRIVTFGKAVGAHGAAVLGSREIKDFLIHACRTFIYSTAMPPEAYSRIQNCLDYMQKHTEKREALHEILNVFAKQFNLPKQHIQLVPIQGIEAIKTIMLEAGKQKMAIKGVWSPTVPEGQERLRISLHEFNTSQEIYNLNEFLKTHHHG